MDGKKTKPAVINAMLSVGTYRPEFDTVIEIFAGMLEQYQAARKQFEQEGAAYETGTATGGKKKSGLVSAMENLRKDIAMYSDRLGLNPKALEALGVKDPPRENLIDRIIKRSEPS